MPTYTTFLIILLVLLLWRWTRGNILSIVAFTSIFDAASVLNIGSLCVSPWLLALVLCLPFKIAQGRLRTRSAAGINRLGLNLLLGFLLCATLSGIVYPFLFSGTPVVQLNEVVPLKWGLPNIAQLCYLCAATMMFFLTITSSRAEVSNALTWYLRGCITAAVIAMYQLVSAITHLPFPEALLYSNTAHVVYHAYRINGMWRLNSTFTEASDMAGSLVGGFGMLCSEMIVRPLRLSQVVWFVLILTAMLMTLSTTGYVCLVVLAVISVPWCLRHLLISDGINPAKLVLSIFFVMAAGTVFFTIPTVREFASKLITSVMLDKRGTDSYRAREESHDQALKALRDTSYVGAGLGSTRASGLAYTLLASTGLPGLLLFAFGYLALFVPFLRSNRSGAQMHEFPPEQCILGLTLLLCGMVLAGSEPNQPVLWLLFGASLMCGQSAPYAHPCWNWKGPGHGPTGLEYMYLCVPESEDRGNRSDWHEASGFQFSTGGRAD